MKIFSQKNIVLLVFILLGNVPYSFADDVWFCVGMKNHCYRVPRNDIEKYPDSMLAKLISGEYDDETYELDTIFEKKPHFILNGIDGKTFGGVLHWISTGALTLIKNIPEATRIARYVNLPSLIEVISFNEFQGNYPWFSEFDSGFVSIPEGVLPDRTAVEAFEAHSYPVTRLLWETIMGEMPRHVPAEKKEAWKDCPNCPVTYVSWENEDGSPAEVQEFLARLNEKLAKTNCTYDLPSDRQLHYMIRGDLTGENKDKYSTGVTDENVNDFVTHWGNSENQVQPVGLKRLNDFGIELGNVWEISKSLYDSAHPGWGRSVRGGSWSNVLDFAGSDYHFSAGAGNRSDVIGFSLVRTCN